jgi:hypothetical protein
MSSSGRRHAIIGMEAMSEVDYQKYEVRSGSSDFSRTQLLQEVEAASFEDLKAYLGKNYPGQNLWITNTTGNGRPFMLVAMKLGPAIQSK